MITDARLRDKIALDGHCFSGSHAKGAVSAEYTYLQLYNPASSGILIYVDAFRIISRESAAHHEVECRTYNTLLADGATAGVNYNNGGSASTGTLRTDTSASVFGASFGSHYLIATGLDTYPTYPLLYPIILGEAEGAILMGQTLNIAFQASWYWREYSL